MLELCGHLFSALLKHPISNQSTGVPSWTKQFIGQSRTASNQANHGYGAVFTINGDGSIQALGQVLSTPVGSQQVSFGGPVGFCDWVSYTVYPIYTNSAALNGLAPHDWAVSNFGRGNSTASECGF